MTKYLHMEMTIYTVKIAIYTVDYIFQHAFSMLINNICLFLIPFFLSHICTSPHIESIQKTNSVWIRCGGLGPAAAGSHREYRNQRICGT